MVYGMRHPTVFLLLAQDGDGNVYFLDEYLRASALPQEHAAAVKAMLDPNNVDEIALLEVDPQDRKLILTEKRS